MAQTKNHDPDAPTKHSDPGDPAKHPAPGDPAKHDVAVGKDAPQATDAEATDGVTTIAEEQRARSAAYEAALGQPPEGAKRP